MATIQCKSCNGTYIDVGADGVPYFHVCAPLHLVNVERAGAWQLVDASQVLPTDSVNVIRAGKVATVLVSGLQDGDLRVGDDTAPRPTPRDENTLRHDPTPNGARIIKSEGKGTTTIA